MNPVASIAGRPNPRITSGYGPDPNRQSGFHHGEDWAFPRVDGDPPYQSDNPRGSRGSYNPAGALAVATLDGVVRYAERQTMGITLRMRHADYDIVYLHLRQAYVYAGQRVTPGFPVGELGGDPRKGRGLPYGRDPFYGDVYGFVHLHRQFEDFNGNILDPKRLPASGQAPDESMPPPIDSSGASFSLSDWLYDNRLALLGAGLLVYGLMEP